MYMTSIFTAGFTVALLRYYKYNPYKYEYFYTVIVSFILCVIVLLGFLENNYLTQFLNLNTGSLKEHFLIYLSVSASLMYIFNRADLTAKGKYKEIVYGITIIFIFRIFALCTTAIFHINDLSFVIFIICILPMCNELLVFGKRVRYIKRYPMSGIGDFILFSLKTAIIGTLFLTSNRLLIITTKEVDNTMAASLSFANGLVGIITILNTTISSFYIGKLDYKDTKSITSYLHKVKKFSPLFIISLAIISVLIYLFVSFLYPLEPVKTAWISVITIIQSGFIFYLGLVTLLVKTYNCLNVQLLINVIVCSVVYMLVTSLEQKIDIISEYIIVNLIIIIGEVLLLAFVLNRYHYDLKNIRQ